MKSWKAMHLVVSAIHGRGTKGKLKRIGFLLALGVVAVTLALFGQGPHADGKPALAAETLTFYQLDIDYDGSISDDSDWGSVDLTFDGHSDILYFNLAVDGTWQVQNVPVSSIEGVGELQTMTYDFDLGVAPGTDVTSLDYDYELTTAIQGAMPGGSTPASVQDRSVVSYSGAQTEGVSLPAAAPLVGGAAVNPVKHAHANFPNQECGKKECAPCAVSNSLQFLNTKHNLGMNAADITIEKMKTATGFVAGSGCLRDTWWQTKKAHCAANNLPVTTKKIMNLSKIAAEIDKGQDVELQGDWHTAAIVGIKDLGGGKFSIDVAHDTEQGPPGGTKTQTITYDPGTGKFSGSPAYFAGSSFRYAVVECPVPVGGIAELPDVAQPSLETAASSGGSSSPPYAAIAGAAAAALALTAGGWYARRRWLR